MATIPTPKCCKCEKTVYVTETIAVLGKLWHRQCFKCDKCDKQLHLLNMSSSNGKPYCKKCLEQLPIYAKDSSPIPTRKQNSSPLPPGKPINIIVFGETGAGKSSVVNMLMDEPVCATSDSAVGCTTDSKPIEKTLIDYEFITLRVYDTAGLGESDQGKISNKDAFVKLVQTLYKTKEDGIHLLLCCHKSGDKISKQSFEENYKAFIETICENNVPSILVITHCDYNRTLDAWKNNDDNQTYVEKNYKAFKTIVTVAADKNAKNLDENEYNLSRRNTIQAINAYALKQPWYMDTIRNNVIILFKRFYNTVQKQITFLKIYPLNEDFFKAFISLGYHEDEAVKEANLLYAQLKASTESN